MAWFRPRPRPPSPGLESAIHALQVAVKQLQDDLASLEHKHERLRGKFYGTRRDQEPTQPETKADILRRFGYVPGKPAPHT